MVPKVELGATHERALSVVGMEELRKFGGEEK